MVRANVEEVAFGGRQRLILKNPSSPKLFPPTPPHPLPPLFFFFFSFFFFLVARSFNITHFPFLYSVPGLGGFCLLQQIQIKNFLSTSRGLFLLSFFCCCKFFAGEVISFFFSFLFPFFSGLPFSYSLP